ncbi:TraM recognition domain-containing protein [Spirosoma sp. BT702]|uniref:TraM recognition domain-containing protein n=1 Tax=Spirosoma profusum TaxID=2771354 RepID=A0A927AUL4_9BACT|nr:TraM recognition domain-containing protein [Spirosoma profusum]MBD2704701.1 TraM recognition domain-containing protein [Spirosoma profusum]
MEQFDLETPLIEFSSSSGKDFWTLRNACSGLQIFGSTGSGKSSASCRLVALKFLQAGMGGLVLTVKPDEVDIWRSYCQMTGRENDLIVIEPKCKHSFNIIDHASGHGTSELAATDNIVEVLNEVIQAGQAQDSGRSDDSFWREQLALLLTNTIDLVKLAYNRISIQGIHEIVQSIPKANESWDPEDPAKAFNRAFMAARVNVNAKIAEWLSTLSPQDQTRFEDDLVYEMAIVEAIPDARILKFVDRYFVDEFIPLAEKTRSIVQINCSGFLYRLLREPFYSLFCRYPSTVTPEDCYEGKIVVINLPTKRYHKAGRDCQMVCKFLFTRAWEQRDVQMKSRPCFLFVDEAQNLLTESDALFLTTARSSRIATVFVTQSVSNYYSVMGGQKAEYRVRSLLGNFGTKLFHSNSDELTNEMCSKLIGDAFFEDATESVTVAQNFSQTRGRSLKLERLVRVEEFARLRSGGPKNNLLVDGYLHRQGEVFANGFNHLKLTFNQNYQL